MLWSESCRGWVIFSNNTNFLNYRSSRFFLRWLRSSCSSSSTTRLLLGLSCRLLGRSWSSRTRGWGSGKSSTPSPLERRCIGYWLWNSNSLRRRLFRIILLVGFVSLSRLLFFVLFVGWRTIVVTELSIATASTAASTTTTSSSSSTWSSSASSSILIRTPATITTTTTTTVFSTASASAAAAACLFGGRCLLVYIFPFFFLLRLCRLIPPFLDLLLDFSLVAIELLYKKVKVFLLVWGASTL